MKDLFEDLNPSQREAVAFCDGPQMVIAGAGSGKTRVLTYKIAYLLQQGLAPWSILALTFTNKAAREMKQRIGDLVGTDVAMRLNMGTFHSVFSRILHIEAEAAGYDRNFTIYDENDSRSLIKAIVKEMGLDDKTYKPAAIHGKISMAKNHLVSAQGYAHSSEWLERDRFDRTPKTQEIFSLYEQRCRAANAMDFDDLLVQTFLLFRDHPEVCDKYQERFAYVLVDEYQDTNYAQQRILQQLTARRRQICVVGDDAQSIYAFRGANLDNMLHFERSFGEFRTFKLEQNYRSTKSIVDTANSLIGHNRHQIRKNVYSENAAGDRVVFRQAFSDKEEALLVCKEISRLHRKEKGEYSDFCILYRTNAQSRNFEDALRAQGIPYRVYGGLSFYQRKEIRDIIAYFRLICNPDDEEAFKRVINYPARGIGQTTVSKIQAAAQAHGVSLWQILERPVQFGLPVNKGTLTKLITFRSLIQSFIAERDSTDAYTLGSRLLQATGILRELQADNTAEGLARQENVGEFVSSLHDFVDTKREEDHADETFLTHFIQETSLLTDQDSDSPDSNEGKVALMTIHAAKGLEFPTVFVVGLEENIFPSPRSANSPREIEEERRLLYVAITRAERHCFLSCAKNRYMYGNMAFNEPSRFLRDISPELLDTEEAGTALAARMRTARTGNPFSDFGRQDRGDTGGSIMDIFRKPAGTRTPRPSTYGTSERSTQTSSGTARLAEGTVIEHQRFGIGTVIRVEGTGENAKATVRFDNAGIKQLLLKFARYKVVGQ